MRLVTWNCFSGLSNRVEALLGLSADIMVIQECSRTSIEELNAAGQYSSAWFGENPRKGLGIVAKMPWVICKAEMLNLKWICRAELAGPLPLVLYALWSCCEKESAKDSYVERIHELLDRLEAEALGPRTFVLGDFNSSSRWDKEYGTRNHSAAVRRLEKLGLVSAYHQFTKEAQGSENQATLYFKWKQDSQYHIDFVFLPESQVDGMKVEIGNYEAWKELSDHRPVIVDLKLR